MDKKKSRKPRMTIGKKNEETEFEKEDRLAKEVKKKLHKEEIDAKQLAAYLSQYSRNGVHFSKDKVIDRLEEICKMSNGLIEKELFRANPGNQKSKYVFDPDVQGIILMLLDTSYFDGRKNDRLLKTREKLYRELVVNAELYLNEDDKRIIARSPQFMNAECESILSEKLNFIIQNLIRTVMHSDETVRLKLMSDVYTGIKKLEQSISEKAIHAFSAKMVYSNKLLEMQNGKLLKEIMNVDDLLHLIIMVLAFRVCAPGYSKINEGKEFTYQNLFEIALEEEKYFLSSEMDKKSFESIADEKELTSKKKAIFEKIGKVIDKNDADEKRIFDDLVFLSKCHEYIDGLPDDEVEVSNRFFELSMQKDMFDLLREFAMGTFEGSPTMLELDRINRMFRKS